MSVVTLLAALIAAAALFVITRRTALVSEVTRILRRYAPLLASVEPIATPPNVPVTEFTTLAKLAERCGQLVLHWSRSGVETFVILDEGTTYRYRTSSSGTNADDYQRMAPLPLTATTSPNSTSPQPRPTRHPRPAGIPVQPVSLRCSVS